MGMGFAPTWLRQVSPLLHKTTLTTDNNNNNNNNTTSSSSFGVRLTDIFN